MIKTIRVEEVFVGRIPLVRSGYNHIVDIVDSTGVRGVVKLLRKTAHDEYRVYMTGLIPIDLMAQKVKLGHYEDGLLRVEFHRLIRGETLGRQLLLHEPQNIDTLRNPSVAPCKENNVEGVIRNLKLFAPTLTVSFQNDEWLIEGGISYRFHASRRTPLQVEMEVREDVMRNRLPLL